MRRDSTGMVPQRVKAHVNSWGMSSGGAVPGSKGYLSGTKSLWLQLSCLSADTATVRERENRKKYRFWFLFIVLFFSMNQFCCLWQIWAIPSIHASWWGPMGGKPWVTEGEYFQTSKFAFPFGRHNYLSIVSYWTLKSKLERKKKKRQPPNCTT